MHQAEIIVGLFAVVAVLVLIARKLGLPYPIVLVLAGLGLSLVPRLPEVKLNPDIVLYFFLPPLIYPAALFTSWRDFRRNLRPIFSLSVGLVLFTIAAVALTVHALVPAISWPAAFALGAIVSPTDAIAATAVIRRLSLPYRIEVVLEGESLVNDATALVALQFALAALMTGGFSLGLAAGRFCVVVIGGIGIGFAVGFLMRWVHRRLNDPPVQITLSLITPFFAYLAAERFHFSGILAVVTAGIYLGWHSPLIATARYRLQAFSFWNMVAFLLNGFVFISIGLQLPDILHALPGENLVTLIKDGFVVSAVAILVRILWVFPATWFQAATARRCHDTNLCPDWRSVVVIAWSGMRGVISLAAAFALPFTLKDGNAFPARNYILFLTFCVIVATLVLQGMTLPVLIRWLRIESDTEVDEEERTARVHANEAAMTLLNELEQKGEFPGTVVSRLREEYQERLDELQRYAETPADKRGEIATREYQLLQHEALKLERDTIIRLRNENIINDNALRRIQRDLDLAESILDID